MGRYNLWFIKVPLLQYFTKPYTTDYKDLRPHVVMILKNNTLPLNTISHTTRSNNNILQNNKEC